MDIKPPFRPRHVATTRRAVDGMVRPTQPQVPVKQPQTLARHTQPQASAEKAAPHSKLTAPKKRNVMAYVQIGVVALLAAGIGLIAQNLPLGEIAIIAYGVIALLRRIPAARSFVFSLVTLSLAGLCVVISATFLAEHFATYTFLLLIIALLSVVRETRWAAKVERSAVNNTRA